MDLRAAGWGGMARAGQGSEQSQTAEMAPHPSLAHTAGNSSETTFGHPSPAWSASAAGKTPGSPKGPAPSRVCTPLGPGVTQRSPTPAP